MSTVFSRGREGSREKEREGKEEREEARARNQHSIRYKAGLRNGRQRREIERHYVESETPSEEKREKERTDRG